MRRACPSSWLTPRQIANTIPPKFEQLESIILRCLAKDVTKRYRTAFDLARDLQRLIDRIGDMRLDKATREKADRAFHIALARVTGNDVLVGDSFGQLLYGGGGDDRLFGRGGQDTLYGDGAPGYRGSDFIDGGGGNDFLVLQTANTVGGDVFGGEGNDIINLADEGSAVSVGHGGNGDDLLVIFSGNGTEVHGDNGNDMLMSLEGRNTTYLFGDNAKDVLQGMAQTIMDGGSGNDVITVVA